MVSCHALQLICSAVTDSRDRGFKGLKQAIKLEFKLGRYDDVSTHLLLHA